MTALPIKRSIAVVVRNGVLVLSRRRPADDDEFPGVWGLPAGTFRPNETLGQLVARIGRTKLGVELQCVRVLSSGVAERPAYTLEMQLVEARMEGAPTGCDWKWSLPADFAAGAASGSLCSRLALDLDKLDSNADGR